MERKGWLCCENDVERQDRDMGEDDFVRCLGDRWRGEIDSLYEVDDDHYGLYVSTARLYP